MKGRIVSGYTLAFREMERAAPNLEKAAGLLETAHMSGDARATYALGTWYLFGRYFDKNEQKAFRLIRRAARQGVPAAIFDLAVSYETGTGVAKSVRCAAISYLRAALRGDDQAVYEVARCFHYGIGVRSDPELAKAWFDRAKELGTYERRSRLRPRKLPQGPALPKKKTNRGEKKPKA